MSLASPPLAGRFFTSSATGKPPRVPDFAANGIILFSRFFLWLRNILLYIHTYISGEGHGNLLQYSCLENPMDRGALWATVHRVTKSRTRLKRLSMHKVCVCIYIFGCARSQLWHDLSVVLTCKSLVVTCGTQFPDLGIEPGPPALGVEVLAIPPPGKSWHPHS